VGIIDSAIITVTCPECGLTESDRILDKGSGWNGSYWGVPSFHKFQVTVTGGYKVEPDVDGICPRCEVAAEVKTQYGT
jgi:hypothetical protein